MVFVPLLVFGVVSLETSRSGLAIGVTSRQSKRDCYNQRHSVFSFCLAGADPMAESTNEIPSDTLGDDLPRHKPYVPDDFELPEFTFSAVLLGAILGIIFGAWSLYLL